MRVAFVTTIISKKLGGIQNTGYYFSKFFPQHIEFEAFCSIESELEGIECTVCKSKYKSNNTMNFHLDLLKMIFQENNKAGFDFTFASIYPVALGCFLLKLFKGIPYGVMMHGNELLDGVLPKGFTKKISTKIRFFFRTIIINNADLLFANSEYTKNLCDMKFNNKNIIVIHPPIRFEDKQGLMFERTYKLFSLGRLEKRKGFQYVIRAMKKIINKYPNMIYYIAGGGPYEGVLRDEIRKLNLCDNVVLLGRISEDEKDKFYRDCDYFLMPSFIVKEESSVEGFGIVFIEANMYGKYVIATQSGGISDAIIEGVTGEFVREQDSSSVAQTILRLYDNQELYNHQACIEWSKKMDIKNIVKQYINSIRGVF